MESRLYSQERIIKRVAFEEDGYQLVEYVEGVVSEMSYKFEYLYSVAGKDLVEIEVSDWYIEVFAQEPVQIFYLAGYPTWLNSSTNLFQWYGGSDSRGTLPVGYQKTGVGCGCRHRNMDINYPYEWAYDSNVFVGIDSAPGYINTAGDTSEYVGFNELYNTVVADYLLANIKGSTFSSHVAKFEADTRVAVQIWRKEIVSEFISIGEG